MLKSTSKQQSEIQLQAECFQWAWATYPQTRYGLRACPNGGKRSIMEAMQFKASGVVAGSPDLQFDYKGRTYYIEMKIPGGVISKDQKRVHEYLLSNGIPIYVCWSFEEFKQTFNTILTY